MWDKLFVVCTYMWMVKAEPSSRSRYTNYLYWAYSCSLYWWMCWRLRYETTHQEQWCSHTVSTAEKSCGQYRMLWDFDYKVRGDSGIRINRLKPLFTDIRCDVKQEGYRKNVNIPRYDVDNVTTKCVHTKLSSQNSKHQTDSVEHRLANLFANGSALASVHFGELSPAYILTISPRFTVGAPVFTQRPGKTIRRINSRLRRCCVNTGAATVNRGEIVSMYAGL